MKSDKKLSCQGQCTHKIESCTGIHQTPFLAEDNFGLAGVGGQDQSILERTGPPCEGH